MTASWVLWSEKDGTAVVSLSRGGRTTWEKDWLHEFVTKSCGWNQSFTTNESNPWKGFCSGFPELCSWTSWCYSRCVGVYENMATFSVKPCCNDSVSLKCWKRKAQVCLMDNFYFFFGAPQFSHPYLYLWKPSRQGNAWRGIRVLVHRSTLIH